MKKLVFAFAAIVAVSFAACGNKTEQAAPADDQAVEEVVEAVEEDSLAQDSTAAPADSAAVEEAPAQ